MAKVAEYQALAVVDINLHYEARIEGLEPKRLTFGFQSLYLPYEQFQEYLRNEIAKAYGIFPDDLEIRDITPVPQLPTGPHEHASFGSHYGDDE